MASHGGTCPKCQQHTSFTKTGLMRSHKRNAYGEHCPYSGVTRAEAEQSITKLAKDTAEYLDRKAKGLGPHRSRSSARSTRKVRCPGCGKTIAVRATGVIGDHKSRPFPGMSTPACRFAGVTPEEAADGITYLDKLTAQRLRTEADQLAAQRSAEADRATPVLKVDR